MKSPSSFPDNLVYLSVCTYLFAHIREPLSVARICRDNRIGRSQLERLFLAHTGNGVRHSFSLFKISAAKQLLVRRDLNISQIADALGYSDVHYFSRRFKQLTGMPPSQYAAMARKETVWKLPWE